MKVPAVGIDRPIGLWIAQAACRGESDGFTSYPGTRAEAARVERTCQACPVHAQCLAYSARHPVEGVWAGQWHAPGRKPTTLTREATPGTPDR